MTEILRVENLKVYFHARKGMFGSTEIKALDDISFSLYKGETLAIVGESGSGKTTLGKSTLKLLTPTGGRIIFDGFDLGTLDRKGVKGFRKRAQGIFQDPYSSLDSFMTVYQILEEPLIVHGFRNKSERTQIIYKVLEDVKMYPPNESANKYPHTLSGGLRQRVGIARALTLTPDYILADEPVSMVDASNRAEILYLLSDIQKQYGVSFLYITHDIATAKHFSNRIAVMYAGRIVEIGLSKDIIENPLHPYTKALIDSIPNADPKNRLSSREVIPGEPPSPSKIPAGCRFHPRCPYAIPGKCDIIDPPITKLNENHETACHLFI